MKNCSQQRLGNSFPRNSSTSIDVGGLPNHFRNQSYLLAFCTRLHDECVGQAADRGSHLLETISRHQWSILYRALKEYNVFHTSVCINYLHIWWHFLLTLMLLVANLAKSKWWQKVEKWLKLYQMGTHLRVFRKSFPMNINMTGFKWFSKYFAS